MKSERGISVLALAITVIVMLIITTITTYNGVMVINDARKKDATDKLSTICNSLRKDDGFLDFSSGDAILTEQDFISMDLKEYYDEDYPVLVEKTSTIEPTRRVTRYVLKMFDGEEMKELYANQEFTIEKALEKNTYGTTFDEMNNINRPILLDDMYAIKSDMSGLVNDIYTDTWYNYNTSAPSFAKMKYDSDGDGSVTDENLVFVWIPRYAYSIQEFYDGLTDPLRPFAQVPKSAMKIVFLREETNYMVNNETLPAGYRVHPAFKAGGKDKPGIWVAMNTSESSATLSGAVSNSEGLVGSHDEIESHLMTNTEYAAALYLMFAYNCFDEIDFTEQDEYVAAGNENNTILKSLDYADLYQVDNGSPTGIANKHGDAMAETNWDRFSAVFPKTNSYVIVRMLKSGYFDFKSVSDSSSFYYRPVIVIK